MMMRETRDEAKKGEQERERERETEVRERRQRPERDREKSERERAQVRTIFWVVGGRAEEVMTARPAAVEVTTPISLQSTLTAIALHP